MGRLLKTNQLLIIYIVVLIAIIVAYAFMFMHIQGKSVSASTNLARIEQLQDLNDELKDISGVLQEIKEDQNKLNSYFVDSEEIVTFLESIEEIGAESGADAEVRSLTEEETENPNIKVLIMNLTATGSWDDVYYFMALIQNYPIKSTFEKIHLTSSTPQNNEEGESGPTKWTAVINMKVLELTK